LTESFKSRGRPFRVARIVGGCIIALLSLSGCSDDNEPTKVKPGPPVITVPNAVGGSTGVDLRIEFSVNDPNHDPVDSVFAVGVWDSLGFDYVASTGRIVWRACKAGSYNATIFAIANGDTGVGTVNIVVNGTPDHYVDMIGGAIHFQPETLFVKEGETVAWRNLDGVPHNVYELSGAVRIDGVKPGCESRIIALNASGGFLAPGQYPYFCTLDSLRRVGPCYVIVAP